MVPGLGMPGKALPMNLAKPTLSSSTPDAAIALCNNSSLRAKSIERWIRDVFGVASERCMD